MLLGLAQGTGLVSLLDLARVRIDRAPAEIMVRTLMEDCLADRPDQSLLRQMDSWIWVACPYLPDRTRVRFEGEYLSERKPGGKILAHVAFIGADIEDCCIGSADEGADFGSIHVLTSMLNSVDGARRLTDLAWLRIEQNRAFLKMNSVLD